MKWQLQREDHNRQDKAKKPNYKDALTEPLSAGGSDGVRIRLADIIQGTVRQKVISQWRIEIATFIERYLRGTLHEVGGYRFSFGMSAHKFAIANDIPVHKAAQIFPTIVADAEDRLAMTKNSALKAEFEASRETSGPGLQITFKNFLRPIKPIDWGHIYKRFRLNAINVVPRNERRA
jgi:hypothetical protein